MISALLDANVLYPAPVRDFLLSLAEDGLFKPFWSEEIHQEWKRNLLINRPDLEPERIDRTIHLMNEAFPDTNVEGYKKHIEGLLLTDPDDRHVLAAALEAKADFLVTANLKDFLSPKLQLKGLHVIHPDEFLCHLIYENPDAVTSGFDKLVSRLKKPLQSKEDVLNTLQQCGLFQTVQKLHEN